MRRTALFFLILVLSLSVIPLTVAQFGEESTSLGQFVDDFENLSNVSVRSSIERNATLNAMELNYSARPDYENFTTYTEVDTNNRITPDGFNISWVGLRRSDASRVYFDYGVGNIDDFNYTFQWSITDLDAGDADVRNIVHMVAIAQTTQAGAGNDEVVCVLRQSSVDGSDDTKFNMQMIVEDGGVADSSVGNVLFNVSQIYWTRMIMDGQEKQMLTYSDSAFTQLEENITITNSNDAYRYLHVVRRISNANDPNDDTDGYIINFLNESAPLVNSYASTGHFSTEDYLDQVNGSTLVQMTNATIPAGTGITISFSADNSTWINETALTDGFNSIDLRTLNWIGSYYLNYSFTGNTFKTPRLYQSRLITTEGTPVLQNVSGIWTYFNASEIGVTVGTLDSGNINSTLDIDGDSFNVSEVVGAPGMQISVNFTGIDTDASCLWLTSYHLYDGNQFHDFDIEFWNFTGSAWVEDSHIEDQTAFGWVNSTIYELRIPLEFMSGGDVRVRLDHEAAGNINHDLSIDFIKILANIPTEVEAGAVEADLTPFIAIAIILMCIAYLLARMR